jgi:predicted RNase H-like HicB family nuclease
MTMRRYVYWQDGEMWLGHFEEFPDYITQGESLAELEENLKDLYADLTGGQIPSACLASFGGLAC